MGSIQAFLETANGGRAVMQATRIFSVTEGPPLAAKCSRKLPILMANIKVKVYIIVCVLERYSIARLFKKSANKNP